jgi:hypothetical protein
MTNQEKAAKLREARALITHPEHWAPHENFIGDDRLCALLACMETCDSVVGQYSPLVTCLVLNLHAHTVSAGESRSPSNALVAYNDTHTHAEVLDMFDRTIERLETL